MAQIPQLSTGIPTEKNAMLRYGSANTFDTTTKNLYIVRKGEVLTDLGIYGNAASNAATTATLSIGGKLLNNTGSALGPVFGVYMTFLGSGYTSAPTVSFSGGGGSGAAATAVINAAGRVIGVTLTAFGSGYTSAPTVSFSGGGGSGAAATAVVLISTTFLNAWDVKTTATGLGQQWPTTTALAQWMPAPFDYMVTATYAETGAASTAGGPWYIQGYYVLPGPNEYRGFITAALP